MRIWIRFRARNENPKTHFGGEDPERSMKLVRFNWLLALIFYDVVRIRAVLQSDFGAPRKANLFGRSFFIIPFSRILSAVGIRAILMRVTNFGKDCSEGRLLPEGRTGVLRGWLFIGSNDFSRLALSALSLWFHPASKDMACNWGVSLENQYRLMSVLKGARN